MKKTASNRFVDLWEKGYLYVIFAALLYLAWFLINNVGVLDWVKEIAYFEYFKTSLSDYHTLPYFWWNILPEVAWRPPIPGTSAIIANPETALFSPFTPLLYLFSAKVYIKLYVVIQFTIGVFGLFVLRKKLDWDNSQFRIFSILFLFSPIIMQHIAVAYFTWYNFYLFPWLVYFIAEKNTIRGIVGTATVLGLIVLQGGIYIVQYLGLFYVLYEVFHIIFEKDWKRIIRLIFVPFIAVLLAWVRISSTASVYGDYVRPWVETDGYNLAFFLFYAFIPTITIPPLNLFFHSDYLGWSLTPHDSGLFWGLSLIMLIIVIIRYKNIVTNPISKYQNGLNYNAIFIAGSILFIVSFYKIWYYLMKATISLEIPLFESIKNHGIRFIMGAFFVYALLLANYSKSIWTTLQQFIKTKFWNVVKMIFGYLFKTTIIILGIVILILQLFQRSIRGKLYEIITTAYNNTGQNWLRNQMEGMKLNSLEFYFNRLDMVYNAIQHWLLILFIILFVVVIISYPLKRYKLRFEFLLNKFPHFKFEMLLAIPLMFSTAMWTNLALSVPYSDYEVLPLSPPVVEIEIVTTYPIDEPLMEAAPNYLKIIPSENKAVNGYVFPQIPANDQKYFEITSKNAILSDKNGQLMLKPLDNKPIKMEFKTEGIWNALTITLLSWVLAISFMSVQVLQIRKKSMKN